MRTTKMKNIVLVDFDTIENWSFIAILEKISGEPWCVGKKITNKLQVKTQNVKRYFWYFIYPLILVCKRRNYDKIIAWQQFYGLNFAFFMKLFNLQKTNELTVMTFIYKKKTGFKGMVYHKYMSYIVKSKYIDRFICFAKEECDYYAETFNVDKCKFMYVPFGVKLNGNVDKGDDGFVFAVGRSNRNYDFLIKTMKDTSYKVIIACDNYKNAGAFPNIKVLNDCQNQDMINIMARCHCVVVPLNDLNVSSGQLVALQAMALGKPVICTKSDGIKDYVVNGKTGFLVKNMQDEWLNALKELYSDMDDYHKMGKCAVELYNERFTEEAMFKRIAKIIYNKDEKDC